MRVFALSLGVLLGALLHCGAARAQGVTWEGPDTVGDDDVAAAREAYSRGLTRLAEDDPAGALIEFRLSYRRAGVAAALFNGAFALTQLGRFVEARAALLTLGQLDLAPEVRESADELSSQVDASLAFLRVVDIPEGAAVSVDGTPAPTDGATLESPVDPGEHARRVQRPPGPPFEWRGALVAGEHRTVAVAFDGPAPGAPDEGLWIGLGVGAGVVVALGAVALVVGLVLDADAQLRGDAPHVIELP